MHFSYHLITLLQAAFSSINTTYSVSVLSLVETSNNVSAIDYMSTGPLSNGLVFIIHP